MKSKTKFRRFSLRLLLLFIAIAGVAAAFSARVYHESQARDRLVKTGFTLAYDGKNVDRRGTNPGFPGGPIIYVDKPEGNLLDIPEKDHWLHRYGLEGLTNHITYLSGERNWGDKKKFAGFVDEDIESISQLRHLKEVNLRCNSITDEGLSKLKNLTDLVHLDLSGNEITDAGLNHLTKLTNLQQLILADNNISDKGILAIAHLKNLAVLDLSETKVTGSSLAKLASKHNLIALSLSQSNFDPNHLKTISAMKKLERLELANTKITDEAGQYIRQLPNLDLLDVSNTSVGDRFIEAIDGIQLAMLGIDGTQVTDKSVEAILRMNIWDYFSGCDSKISWENSDLIEDQVDKNYDAREEETHEE